MFSRDDQPFRLGLLPIPFLLASALVAAGCSFDTGQPPSPECTGINCDAGLDLDPDDDPPPQFDAAPAAPESPVQDAGETLLCPGACLPDDPLECADYSLESREPEASNSILGIAGLASDAGAVRDAGSTLAPSAPPVDASSGDQDAAFSASDASALDAASDGAPPFVPVDVDANVDVPAAPDQTYSCQMVPTRSGLTAGCAAAGPGVDRDACSSNVDCAAGLGCVGRPGAGGRCLPFCCEGGAACAPGRICAQRPLLSADNPDSALTVPVCALPDQCDLMDPYPCPEGQNCSCPQGLACTAVGTDGARACVQPGAGQDGDECPCAAGYFCSPLQNQCIKQCRFGTDVCGAAAICQAVRGFPEDYGLCVALPPGTED